MRGFNVYALTKVLGEEMARQFCLNDPDMRITCLRLSNVMDPQEYTRFEGWQDDPTRRLWNMWTYIDNRDAAQAIECAIRYEARGKDAFLITNDETVMRTPTAELLERHFPKAERRKAFARQRGHPLEREGQAGPGLQAGPPLDRRGLRA